MAIFKDELKDVTEGSLLFIATHASGVETSQAFRDTTFEVHKYAAGCYGIPVTRRGQAAVLKMSSSIPKARFKELLIDGGWIPFVTRG